MSCWLQCSMLTFLFRVVFGTLYPAYSSYKAVKSKDVKEYVSILSNSITQAMIFQDVFAALAITLFTICVSVSFR